MAENDVLPSVPLAERRDRRQKWSADPRNKFWLNDKTKFGSRMLAKMGWTEGKGLGLNEQGAADFVQPNANTDSRGLGAVKKPEDAWIGHQTDFDAMLKTLNAAQTKPDDRGDSSSDKLAEPPTSLESVSRTSRSRIHYHKFTRGKDLSTRNSADLAGIFGRRERKKNKKKHSQSGEDAKEETIDETKEETQDKIRRKRVRIGSNASPEHLPLTAVVLPEHSTEPAIEERQETTVSSLSVQDYFRQKMSDKLANLTTNSPESTVGVNSRNSAEPCDTTNTSSVPPAKKMKKIKKKKNRKEQL